MYHAIHPSRIIPVIRCFTPSCGWTHHQEFCGPKRHREAQEVLASCIRDIDKYSAGAKFDLVYFVTGGGWADKRADGRYYKIEYSF